MVFYRATACVSEVKPWSAIEICLYKCERKEIKKKKVKLYADIVKADGMSCDCVEQAEVVCGFESQLCLMMMMMIMMRRRRRRSSSSPQLFVIRIGADSCKDGRRVCVCVQEQGWRDGMSSWIKVKGGCQ